MVGGAPRARTGTDRLAPARPLVGRAHEARGAGRRARPGLSADEPQMVTLVGPPGIGKSRQVWELYQQVERSTELIVWRQGRSLPYGDGITFWALAEIVKAHAGILATDPAAGSRRSSGSRSEDAIADANEARWIEAHLAPLAGLTTDRELRGDHRTEAFTAWRRFLEAVAARARWSWCSRICTGRTTACSTSSPTTWSTGSPAAAAGGRHQPAGAARAAAGLGRRLRNGRCSSCTAVRRGNGAAGRRPAGCGDLPAQLRSALLASAGGNPLFAEEYVRMLLDRGLLRRRDGLAELAGSELPMPESVQSIVAARLDALPSEEKLLVQDASVVGRAFWLGALSEIGRRQRWSVEHSCTSSSASS